MWNIKHLFLHSTILATQLTLTTSLNLRLPLATTNVTSNTPSDSIPLTPSFWKSLIDEGVEKMSTLYPSAVRIKINSQRLYYERKPLPPPVTSPAEFDYFVLSYSTTDYDLYLNTILNRTTGLPMWAEEPFLFPGSFEEDLHSVPWPPAIDIFQANANARAAGKMDGYYYVQHQMIVYGSELLPVYIFASFLAPSRDLWAVRSDIGEVIDPPPYRTLSGVSMSAKCLGANVFKRSSLLRSRLSFG